MFPRRWFNPEFFASRFFPKGAPSGTGGSFFPRRYFPVDFFAPGYFGRRRRGAHSYTATGGIDCSGVATTSLTTVPMFPLIPAGVVSRPVRLPPPEPTPSVFTYVGRGGVEVGGVADVEVMYGDDWIEMLLLGLVDRDMALAHAMDIEDEELLMLTL